MSILAYVLLGYVICLSKSYPCTKISLSCASIFYNKNKERAFAKERIYSLVSQQTLNLYVRVLGSHAFETRVMRAPFRLDNLFAVFRSLLYISKKFNPNLDGKEVHSCAPGSRK